MSADTATIYHLTALMMTVNGEKIIIAHRWGHDRVTDRFKFERNAAEGASKDEDCALSVTLLRCASTPRYNEADGCAHMTVHHHSP